MAINDADLTTTISTRGIDAQSNTQTVGLKQLPLEFYQHFLSHVTKKKGSGGIHGLLPLENTPGVISLLVGKPNDAMFPFESPCDPLDSSRPIPLLLAGPNLAEGLQYSTIPGLLRLIDWLAGLQQHVHGRGTAEGWRVTIGHGSQDIIYKAVSVMMNPGEPLLIETPVYSGALTIFCDLQLELVEVATDEEGVRASDLRSILENWPSEQAKPKQFYTVPYGCNPSGTTATTERRREVLQLAREHNFLILKDDPYYYLYFGKNERPPSYFTLKLEMPELGHVIRFDSFSKTLIG